MNYLDLIIKIKNEGIISHPRNCEVKELIDEHITISNNNTLICLPNVRDVTDPNSKEGQYLRAEFVWYMSGSLLPNYISRFGSMWNKLTNQFNVETNSNMHGTINSNYGNRVFFSSPLDYITSSGGFTNSFDLICNELTNDSDSRKAIIQYTTPYMYLNDVRDFTCTQTQQFLIRQNKLYNIVNIRSSDAIKGLSFDMPWWDFIGQCIAKKFNVDYDNLYINIGSSHYYSTDEKTINNLTDLKYKNDFKMKKLILKNKMDIEKVNKLLNDINVYFTSFDKKYNANSNITDMDFVIMLKDNFNKNIKFVDFDNYTAAKILSSLVVNLVEQTSITYYSDKEKLIKFNNEIFDIIFDIE